MYLYAVVHAAHAAHAMEILPTALCSVIYYLQLVKQQFSFEIAVNLKENIFEVNRFATARTFHVGVYGGCNIPLEPTQ